MTKQRPSCWTVGDEALHFGSKVTVEGFTGCRIKIKKGDISLLVPYDSLRPFTLDTVQTVRGLNVIPLHQTHTGWYCPHCGQASGPGGHPDCRPAA